MFKKPAVVLGIGLLALLITAGGILTRDLWAQEEPAVQEGKMVTAALGTAFSYQGQVANESGDPIDGACDLRFGLYDALNGGAKVGEVTSADHPVVGGLFAVSLDFGAGAFRGDARWLEIAVRCPAGSGTYTTLSPRQELAAVPYALSLRPGAHIDGSVPAGPTFEAGLRVTNRSANYPIAIVGVATATQGPSIGVAGNNSSPTGFGVYGYSLPGINAAAGRFEGTGTARGVWASSVDWHGVYGYSKNQVGVVGSSDNFHGMWGESFADNTYGVYGVGKGLFNPNNPSQRIGNSTGVVGESWVDGRGVWGLSRGGNGVEGHSSTGVGVYGWSQTGLAARFDGTTRTKILEITGGSDLAERFQVSGGVTVEPGTVMVIDPDNPGHLTPATTAYDRKVAGVVSGAGDVETGLVLHQEGVLEGDTIVAIAGRVYVRAEAFSGPITPGDMLTTSDLAGYAMVAADHDRAQGAVIGKAMTGLDSGTGLVLVLVNLQ